MSKKRNHVNQFIAMNPDWEYEPLCRSNVSEVIKALDLVEKDCLQTESAVMERKLTRRYLETFDSTIPGVHGGVINVNGRPVALAVGDVRGDTLLVQIEKASREITGAHEMMNKVFAEKILRQYPHLKYVNREEDAGDPGLRQAKRSYHPVKILEKYAVRFKN